MSKKTGPPTPEVPRAETADKSDVKLVADAGQAGLIVYVPLSCAVAGTDRSKLRTVTAEPIRVAFMIAAREGLDSERVARDRQPIPRTALSPSLRARRS